MQYHVTNIDETWWESEYYSETILDPSNLAFFGLTITSIPDQGVSLTNQTQWVVAVSSKKCEHDTRVFVRGNTKVGWNR